VRFVDANVLIHAAIEQHPLAHSGSQALMDRLIRGQEEIHLTDMVSVETAVNLGSARAGRLTKQQIADFLLPLTQLSAVSVANKSIWPHVFDVYVRRNIDLGDAHVVALMARMGANELYSFDTDFDDIPGVVRLEP